MPPPRGGLLKGDYVLVSGVWFEMMNSAPGQRPSTSERSISDTSGRRTELPSDGRTNASSEVQGTDRDQSTVSNATLERDEFQALKPRPVQTRSTTATSASYRSNPLQESHSSSARRDNVGDGYRDVKDRHGARDEELFEIPKPGYHAGCSTCGSTSDLNDSEEGMDQDRSSVRDRSADHGSDSRCQGRDGYAMVNGVYHQMLKPGPAAQKPGRKLQKIPKGVKAEKESSVGGGNKGPRMIVP